MMTEYAVRNYGTRVKPFWSVDAEIAKQFVYQIAFWFRTRALAEARMAGIEIEDAERRLRNHG